MFPEYYDLLRIEIVLYHELKKMTSEYEIGEDIIGLASTNKTDSFIWRVDYGTTTKLRVSRIRISTKRMSLEYFGPLISISIPVYTYRIFG